MVSRCTSGLARGRAVMGRRRYAFLVRLVGWLSSRRRLRRSTERALAEARIDPAPHTVQDARDCRAQVLQGLWPPEFSVANPGTEVLADHLRLDLKKIAENANERIRKLPASGWHGEALRAEEARLVEVARTFAVQRVESTLRQLRSPTR